ncbi:S-layer homology domain-containing protein [Nitriliruptoraceae bacterium ZYF776]|nr:S-layer homology domain-containing protein [Profundirhabdus halotolerans]
MNRSLPRRLGALTTALALAGTLFAPGVAAADPADPAGAASVAPEAAADGSPSTRSAAAARDVEVRSLDFACPRDRTPSAGFRDSEGVYGRAIDCLVWYGITEGRTPNAFDPNRTVNRREMAIFLHRLLVSLDAPLPEYDGNSRFRDVPDTGFGSAEINVLASPEVEELLGRVVVAGRPDGTFDSPTPVSREQMASFIARTFEGIIFASDLELIPGFCSPACFPDSNAVSPPHRPNVDLLFQAGIVTGRADGTYGPRASVNRGQMALFLTRMIDFFAEPFPEIVPDARR